ncbi:DUF3592 domain-containing protein [Luteolibacter sp. Populi]|uniref:DUF3592 domain-containing protein n=1 Tax=Luteolibacter sp. Populi TaxID=3230487 RepID=UPI00346725AA
MNLRLQKREPLRARDMGSGLAIFLGCIGLVLVVAATGKLVSVGMGYWKTRTDIGVPAKIESLKINSYTGRSPTTSMRASYSYEWDGRQFKSDRVSLFDEKVKVRSLMLKAFESGQTVEAWIDPSDPAYSVIDREWQGGEFTAIIAIQIGFGGMTIYCFVIARFGSRRGKRKRHFGKPLLRLP